MVGTKLFILRQPRLSETKSLALRTETGLELRSGPQKQGHCGSRLGNRCRSRSTPTSTRLGVCVWGGRTGCGEHRGQVQRDIDSLKSSVPLWPQKWTGRRYFSSWRPADPQGPVRGRDPQTDPGKMQNSLEGHGVVGRQAPLGLQANPSLKGMFCACCRLAVLPAGV